MANIATKTTSVNVSSNIERQSFEQVKANYRQIWGKKGAEGDGT